MAHNLHVVILAGGKGERFWPLSTREEPKPFLKLFSDRSLLQQTFDRARGLAPIENIWLVVGRQHAGISHEQLPEVAPERLLVEPVGRDTAAAIGYASLHLPKDALMLLLPADHLIPDATLFRETIAGAADFVEEHGGPCTFGVRPDRPETNYGYVKALPEPAGERQNVTVYFVEQFVEKPDRTTAEEYVRQGSYYWNSGIFLWRVGRIQDLLQLHLPDLWKGLQQLKSAEPSRFSQLYAELPRISIDFGVMQKTTDTVVVPASFRWDDIGTWTSLLRVLPADTDGNLVRGDHIGIDTTNCILYAENHKMATIGVQDLIVVQKGGHILICHKSHADRLKELLSKLPQ